MQPLALSTMWLQRRFDHLIPFFEAGQEMGFQAFEFSAVALHIPDQAIRTCEFDWHFAPVGVKAGVEHLRRAGCSQ